MVPPLSSPPTQTNRKPHTTSQVLAPAIHYATNGFPVSEVIASEWADSMTNPNDTSVTSKGKFPHAADGFWATFSVPSSTTADGVDSRRAPQAGEIFRNPDLANTLSLIATGGCDAFYNGSVAQAIAEFAAVGVCARACVRACVRVCVRACVRACVREQVSRWWCCVPLYMVCDLCFLGGASRCCASALPLAQTRLWCLSKVSR